MSPKSVAWLSGLFVYFFLLGTACLLRPPEQVLKEAFLLTLAALFLLAALLLAVVLVGGIVIAACYVLYGVVWVVAGACALGAASPSWARAALQFIGRALVFGGNKLRAIGAGPQA